MVIDMFTGIAKHAPDYAYMDNINSIRDHAQGFERLAHRKRLYRPTICAGVSQPLPVYAGLAVDLVGIVEFFRLGLRES